MNRVILVGRLVKDPELRRTSTDIPVVQFVLAVNRPFSRNAEQKADFINCVVWRQAAENLAKYMRKGSQIGVEGQLQVRSFDDANGFKRYVTEVVCDQVHFLESKRNSDSLNPGFSDIDSYDIPSIPSKNEFQDEDPFKNVPNKFGVSDDDLPF